jgi:HEAT repeat protein
LNESGEGYGSHPVSVGVFTVDTDLNVRTWDDWMASATGLSAEQVRGRSLTSVVPSLAERGLLDEFRNVLRTGEARILAPALHHYLVPSPPRVPSTNFAQMQQRATLGPLRDGEAIVGVMAVVEDVTARLDAERALAAALESADDRKREQAARQLSAAADLVSPELFSSALGDSNWRVRREVVTGLARHADGTLMRSLLSSLRREHRNFNVLSSALQLLSASDVDVTDSLIDLLNEGDADVRIQAALALGEQRRPAAVEALTRALADPDTNVRFHAIEALGRLRARDGVDALVEIARGEFFLAFAAIDALSQIADPRAAPQLAPLLSTPELTDAVAEALGELGDATVVPPLVDALNRDAPVSAVVRALATLHARAEERSRGGELVMDAFCRAIRATGEQRLIDAVTNASVEDLRSYALVLGWIDGAAAGRALTSLLAEPKSRAAVIEAIARQGDRIVGVLIAQLGAEDIGTRIAAVTALDRIGSRQAVPSLIPLLDSADGQLVAAAASTLGHLGGAATFEPLLRLVRHRDPLVRQAVVGALSSTGHPDMAQRIGQLLEDADPLARECAVRIGGYFGYPECAEQVLARCDDEDERVRCAAIEQLPYSDDPRAVDLLQHALRRPSARERAAAAQALGLISDARATPLLLDATSDDNAWVRYFAMRSLGVLGASAAIGRAIALAAGDPATHVRVAAVEALGRLDGREAAEVLLSHVTDTNADIAAAALRALGSSLDPRAERALAESARSDDPARRLAAVEGLAQHPTPERITLLSWVATAGDTTAARAAIQALATAVRNDDCAETAMSALLAIVAHSGHRDGAIHALSELPVQHIGGLEAAFDGGVSAIRDAVVRVLCRMRHPDASAVIRKALDDPEPSIREAAIRALDELGGRGVLRRFEEMARLDPSTAVRRAAAAALARQPQPASDDERPRT